MNIQSRHLAPTLVRPVALALAFSFGLTAAVTTAQAAEPDSCRTVRLATPGWTDIDATNALASVVLKALDYQPKLTTLSVPLAYQGLRSGQLDVFLGNWMPAQQGVVEPLLAKQQIEVLGVNLARARFTLAVPSYAADAGVQSFADLNAHAAEFSKRIYGIEAGAPANELIKKMIASNAYGLGEWKLVESSDTGLLAQLGHDIRAKKNIVFLAWEPHIVNSRHNIRYLTGGDAYFGPDTGAASVRTVSRPGYRTQCENVGRLLAQLLFTVELENQMISANVNEHLSLDAAARKLLQANGPLLKRWLDGVKTRDGRDAAAAVQAALVTAP